MRTTRPRELPSRWKLPSKIVEPREATGTESPSKPQEAAKQSKRNCTGKPRGATLLSQRELIKPPSASQGEPIKSSHPMKEIHQSKWASKLRGAMEMEWMGKPRGVSKRKEAMLPSLKGLHHQAAKFWAKMSCTIAILNTGSKQAAGSWTVENQAPWCLWVPFFVLLHCWCD